MNYLWGGMILIGIIYGTVTGHLEEVSEAAIQSSKEAVSLCVVMAGVTALWVGMMRIAEVRTSGGDGAENAAGAELFVSGNPRESPVEEIDCNESAGEYPGTRLGGDTGRAEGHGRAGRSGGRAAKEKAAGGADRCSQQRDVRFPDPEYFLPAADSGQHYCLSDGIRKRGTHSDRGTGDSCNSGQHRDCHILY